MKIRDAEICHLYDKEIDSIILSRGNAFWGRIKGLDFYFKVPLSARNRLFISLRLFRRLLRLDKSNAIYSEVDNLIYIVYLGNVYLYYLDSTEVVHITSLHSARNSLHCSITEVDGFIYLGEYTTQQDVSVPIWRGRGKKWEVVYLFNSGDIRHIHGIYYDKYENSIWITTGDFQGQCKIIKTNTRFDHFEVIGDGTQQFRAVSLLFSSKYVFWAMDSPDELNYAYLYDRCKHEYQKLEHLSFEGPVWYAKNLSDGYLIQSSVENGCAKMSDFAVIYYSENLIDWIEITRFKKDILPSPYFKNGVISFCDGAQHSKEFVFFGEALRTIDGKVFVSNDKGQYEQLKNF